MAKTSRFKGWDYFSTVFLRWQEENPVFKKLFAEVPRCPNMRIHAALHASLLEQCFRLVLFQHLAIRYHFSIYHQRRSCHHAVGGDLREIRHMVNGRVSPQFRESGADKLLLADWGFEVMGDELYGKV